MILEWNEDSNVFEPRFFDFGDRSPPKPGSTSKIPPAFNSCRTSIRGFDRAGNVVDIGLVVELGPRRVIPHEGRHLGNHRGTELLELQRPTATPALVQKRGVRFLAVGPWNPRRVRSRAIGNPFSSERSEAVRGRPSAGRLGIRCFVAKFVDGSGSDLFDKLSPPELSQTPLAALAPHERGAGPRLDILDNTGGLHNLALLQVFATMHFPGHDVAERDLRAACGARWEIGQAHRFFERATGEEPELAFHWPEFLYMLASQGLVGPLSFREIASPPPNLDSELDSRRARGLVAGQLLLNVLACSIHHQDHASLGKAVFLYTEELKIKNKSKPKAEQANNNRTKIFQDWSRMRSVAHLWAAAWLVHEADTEAFWKSPAEFLPRLLATSEALRIHGEHHWAPGPNGNRRPHLGSFRHLAPAKQPGIARGPPHTRPIGGRSTRKAPKLSRRPRQITEVKQQKPKGLRPAIAS